MIRKNIVSFPSIKASKEGPILVESILESKYCLYLEFDPNVKFYMPQPKKFKLEYFPDIDLLLNHRSDNGYHPNFDLKTEKKLKVVRYTPDFYVEYHNGGCKYVEVKPAYRATNSYYQKTFSLFRSYLNDHSIEFDLVDETSIQQEPLLPNYETLFLYNKNNTFSMRLLYEAKNFFSSPVRLDYLFKKIENTVSKFDIYTWIAFGYLTFDMKNILLNNKVMVSFNV